MEWWKFLLRRLKKQNQSVDRKLMGNILMSASLRLLQVA